MFNLSLSDKSMTLERTINFGEAKLLQSKELFAGEKQIYIEHNGEVYTLKITKNGKLLLVK